MSGDIPLPVRTWSRTAFERLAWPVAVVVIAVLSMGGWLLLATLAYFLLGI